MESGISYFCGARFQHHLEVGVENSLDGLVPDLVYPVANLHPVACLLVLFVSRTAGEDVMDVHEFLKIFQITLKNVTATDIHRDQEASSFHRKSSS